MDQSTALTLECGGAAGFSETEGRVNELEVVKPKTAENAADQYGQSTQQSPDGSSNRAIW